MRTYLKVLIAAALLIGAVTVLPAMRANSADTRPARDAEIAEVQKYLLVEAPFLDGRELTAADFEARCSVAQRNERSIIYSIEGSDIVVCEAERMKEVAQINAFVYVQYVARDGREVTLTYSEQGLYGYDVYDPAKDRLITKTVEDEALVYRHFRN